MPLFSFYKKDLRFDQNLMCFISLYFPRSCVVLVVNNKTKTSFLKFSLKFFKSFRSYVEFLSQC